MNHTQISRLSAVVLAATLALGFTMRASVAGKTIQLPPDGVQLKVSTLPGYAKAQAKADGIEDVEKKALELCHKIGRAHV